jgi:ubiquinone biosynthesis protein
MTRDAWRLEEIVRILAKYGLAGWLGRSLPEFVRRHLTSGEGERLTDVSHAARVRLALTELGTTFIKIGQVLSSRTDLVGTELSDELSKLQTEVPADPPEVVRETIEAELGSPPDELFASFDDEALASASIGQVHGARLHDGTLVVVKVQHPDIERRIVSDLDLLARLAEIAVAHRSDLRVYRPRALVEELRRSLLQELDFGRELRNLEHFRRDFDHDPKVTFPKPFSELSGRRVLTMERVEGLSVRQVDQLAARGVDPGEVAHRGADLYLSMIFRHGFYHADPHPGNVLVLDGGVICLLDSGMVGTLDEKVRGDLEGLIVAAVQGDQERMADQVMSLGSMPRGFDRDALAADLGDFVSDYGDRDLETWDFSEVISDLMSIIQRHHIVLPQRVALLLRTLVSLEGTSRLLTPDFSLGEVLKPYALQAMGRELSPKRIRRKLARAYRDWDRLIEILPRELTQVLLGLREGSFDVHLEHRRLEAIVHRLVYGILCAALIVGAASLWSAQVPPRIGGVSVLGTLFGVMAGFMAWRLRRAIGRFGGLGKKDGGRHG